MIRYLLLATVFASAAAALPAQTIAPTPPMGWNSWDAYGFALDEAGFRANAAVLAGLKDYGWNYAVIDEGWYFQNPVKPESEAYRYDIDANGRFVPDPIRYPSAADGNGFRTLANWAHGRGLKFGLHIVRGIPRAADPAALIAGSSFHIEDAEDRNDACPWDKNNYGVRDTPAGQAYYNSMLRLYADWGLDFLKVDCISDHPYKAAEIRMLSSAIKATGRPIVLSLSPGPTNLSHAAEVGQLSQMWRIADDLWDAWSYPGKPWPNGLESAFDNLAKWAPYAKAGNWPDADMLPWGELRPNPGWGKPRTSGLTHDEMRTELTLWAVGRSPLILGANLTLLDDFTRSLLTSREVIRINQAAAKSEQLPTPDPARFRLWSVTMPGKSTPGYLAVFNLQNETTTWSAAWKDLQLASITGATEVWTQKPVAVGPTVSLSLPPHGCALLRLGS